MRKRIVRSAKLILFGSGAAALVTFLCYRFHANFAIAGFLFLLLVLLQSFSGNFISTVVVSVEAVAALDYFFIQPLHSFDVGSPLDVVALASFLATSLVVTRLVSRVRSETESARLQQERTACLYRLAQKLLAMDFGKSSGAASFLDVFPGTFGIASVCLFEVDTAEMHTAGEPAGELAERTRDAYFSERDSDDPVTGAAIRRLQISGKTTACIGFAGLDDPELSAGPLAALAGIVLERMRALHRASESEAAAQAEVYRSAILDALAHEFKTPLATILAAAGGLREAGPLRREQLELTETVESEAARLGSLTSRLLRVARLDREEVTPRIELTELVSLMEELVGQYARRSPDLRVFLLKRTPTLHAQVDPQLLRLAVSQLLENACKYSQPGSTVSLQVQGADEFVEIRISNVGSAIPLHEQNRIFDRFYRGSNAAQFAPGSGLGLHIARKIALAHGGSLKLENDGLQRGEVSFCLSLPARRELKDESDRVATTS